MTETLTSSVLLTSSRLLSSYCNNSSVSAQCQQATQVYFTPEQQPSATVCTADRYKANPAPGLCSLCPESPTATHETLCPSILEILPTSRASTRSRVRDPISGRSCTARQNKALLQGPGKVSSQASQPAGCRLQLRGEHGRRRRRRRRKRRVVG